ncbi:hypothetical protein [Alishewanella sp. SMS8]|uniref:hypothetical protein n=1 Tax=Alishewanella sp. SMS8 TaxID=2994676 RepID=UPI002741214F|nr:hypothetical protein [Alishewanella sp. SMS8]MDP4946205.1 hypothetical protein [Alishewanella sp.]MDP5459353.1 hypothetical protein [Alishewanella sp. SMS8]
MPKLILTKLSQFLKKSRLAGFFVFVCLLGCQPSSPTTEQQLLAKAQTDAVAARTVAQQRLASNELEASLQWWRHAAKLGASDAFLHAIQLQQRLEGPLATAHWLQQQLVEQPQLTADLPSSILMELGLWPESLDNMSVAWQSPAGCRLTLQPVVTQAEGERSWHSLQQAWQADPQLATLPVCFKPLLRITSTALNCSEVTVARIHCDYQALSDAVLAGDFQQLLVIAGRGVASYNNGIVQLPAQANLALLRHEFLHIAGFLDEYALSAISARAVCRAGRVAPNLLIGNSPELVARYQQQYAIDNRTDLALTPVDTCRAVNMQAYRPIAALNPMRHLEAPLPPFYWQLLQQQLAQSEQLMPVQYYFAFLARQQQAWQHWQSYMQAAAAFGYPAAIAALEVEG